MPRGDHLSASAVELLQEPHLAILATIMRDGSPQTTPVWVDVEDDGSHLLINTVRGHLKQRNIDRDPRVAVTVVDAANPFRSVVVRGTVVAQLGPEQGATAHITKMNKKYTGRDEYPLRAGESRVILRIKPTFIAERGAAGGVRWRDRTTS